MTVSIGVTIVLIALKAFALGTSGSTSVLVSLTESGLDLAAIGLGLLAIRWSAKPAAVGDPELRGETMAALVQVGLVLASATIVGLIALSRIFDPRPVGGGWWGVGVFGISILVTLGLIAWQTRRITVGDAPALRGERLRSLSDLGSSVVALIGVASGALLDAPGLDAAAGLVIAVWLFWGGLTLLKTTVSGPSVAPDGLQ